MTPALTPALSTNDIVYLYAVKHNPFAYFRSIQEGDEPGSSLDNIVGFDGPRGLYADLSTGSVPAFSIIAPNQCNDQHGRGNAGPYCNYDPNDDGSQAGLNPALMLLGDVAVKRLVTAIKLSPIWTQGQSATPYNHFSLLKSIEAGFGLPCLNHACDANVNVMSDLFSGTH